MNFKSHGHIGHGILYFGEALIIGANLAIAKYNERGYKSLGADVKAGGIAGDIVQYGVLTNNPTALKAIKSGSSYINYNNLSDRQVGKIYAEIRDGFLSEMRNSADTADLKRVVDRLSAGTESDVMLDTIKYAALQVMNENPSKYSVSRDGISTESGQSGSAGIDSGAESGYNGGRGESYADNDRKRLGENAENGSEADRRGEEETGGAWRESKENDLRGAQEGQDGGRSQERIHVKQGSRDIYYKPGRADESVGSSAVDILNDAWIDAVLCDGDITTGSGKAYSEALTMPDGTVYVSNNATLPASQIAAHEAVHSYEVRGSEYYAEYEAVICDDLLWGSEPYAEIANHLNDEHYSGKYDIDSIDFAKLFIREVSAYVNQYVATDMERANERFSGIFKDWQAVVDASRQFNKNIGADFSESAFFAPETVTYDSVFGKLSGADGEADSYKRLQDERLGTKLLTEDQKRVQSIGKTLGIKTVFKDLDISIKNADGRREVFRPNGFYDKKTDTVYINSSRNFDGDALMTVFKHELTHFAENAEPQYKTFCDAAKQSEEYKTWLRQKTNTDEAVSVDQMSAKLNSNIRELYSRKGINLSVAEAQREIYADFAGDILFSRDGKTADRLINSISESKRPKVIEAVLDFIKYLREKIKGEKDISFGLIRLETKYKNALKNTSEAAGLNGGGSENGSGKSYSIAYTTENNPVAIIDDDILDGVPKSDWVKTVKKTISERFSDGIPIGGRLIRVNQKTLNEFANSNNSQWYAKNDQVIYADKFKSANNLDDIVLASTNYINEDLKHKRKDKFTEFARGDVLIRVGETDYSAKVIVGFTSGKQMVLYDVIDFSPASFEIKKTDMRSPSNRINAENGSNIPVFDTTVSQKEQSVNTNISENRQKDTESRKYSIESDTATDYSAEMDELWNMARSGEIDKQQFDERVNELFKNAAEEYGSIPKGENYISSQSGKGSDYTNPVPKKIDSSSDKVRQFARTIMEGGNLNDEMLSEVKQLILSGQLSYTPSSDNSLINYA